MSKRWTETDLGGGGLQSANLRLTAVLRKRSTAYALLALFPLGMHRDYLHDPRGAWLYRGLSGMAVAAYLLGESMISAGVLAALACGAVYDMVSLERMITHVNKRLRMQVYLRQAPGAPPDFKGRFPDARTDPGPPDESRHSRVPSFAELERLLRDQASGRSREDKSA